MLDEFFIFGRKGWWRKRRVISYGLGKNVRLTLLKFKSERVTSLFSRKLSVFLIVVMLLSLTVSVAAQERMGTWVDEVIIVEEQDVATAVSRLSAGDLDIWATTSSNATQFNVVVNNPALDYYTTFGSYSELTYNPAGPEFNDGRYNPLSNRRIREATNMLIDRDYLAQEIYGGLAVPKFSMLNNAYVDYSRVVETARALEAKYAYDLEAAREIIAEEMVADGAELVNGVWHYNGSPVEILVLARNEDERELVGDYVAEQFGKIGFVTSVDHRSNAEASPIWLSGDPNLGQWHVYTGGWGAGAVYRDQGHNFTQMYTTRGMAAPLWLAMDVTPELDEIAERLYYKTFSTMEERNELYSRALELGFIDSPRIYTVDQVSFLPRRAEVTVSSDLAGGISSNPLWPSTIRREDEVGGIVTIGSQQVLINPWNPVAGSNQAYDLFAIRATFDRGFISDPFTGNYLPHRIGKVEVTAVEGLPITKSPASDWVTLDFVPAVEVPGSEEAGIEVPGDAFLYWDGDEQRFVTVEEVYPEGLTAQRKSIIHYREDLFDAVKWHDGTPFSIGDMLFQVILNWDRMYEGSAVYDESAALELPSAQRNARGWRIISEDPFIYEVYATSWYMDAEQNLGDIFATFYDYGSAPWHTLALGMLAEINNELAFSSAKATANDIEQLGLHMGPSLPILNKWLDVAIEDNYLPYASFLSDYVSEEEIANRYANAENWYQDKGHFWIGNGPMYLERAYSTEKMVHLKRFADYSEPADKWAMFDEPRIAEVEVFGPGRVSSGSEAVFEVDITFKDELYPLEHIQEVKYIVLDAAGNVAYSGYGSGISDGLFEVVLDAEDTANLPVGSNTLEVIVLPTLVGGATFGAHTFVTLP